MYEQEAARQQRLAYEKMLYRYSTALEQGDFDTIIAILKMAERDSDLEQMIIEAHSEGYQQEERGMHQNDTSPQLTQPPPSTVPSLSQRVRKPRKRWLIALEGLIAVLVAAILVGSTLFLFTTHSKQQTRGNSTSTAVPKTPPAVPQTPPAGIVVAASTQHFAIGDDITLIARDVNTGALLWQSNALGKLGEPNLRLASADQTVYVAYNKQVWAFQVSDGKLLWHQTLGTDDPAMYSNPSPQLVVEQNIVYASGYSSGNLYALEANTGKILWSYNASMPALLAISNGIAYVLVNDSHTQNGVEALQGTNGHVLWHYDTTMPLSATVADNVLYVQASHDPTGDPNAMYKGQKPLFALNATNGSAIWSTFAPANAPSPLVVAQGVVVLFDGNHFCGYQASSGKPAWCTTGPQNDINGAGLLNVDGIVYGVYNPSFNRGLVEAINPQNGQIYWSQDVDTEGSNSLQILSLGNNLILPQMVLNRTNGAVLWKFPDAVVATAVNN